MIQSHSGTVRDAIMRVCITGSGGLHKSDILHIPGSTRPAEMFGSYKVNWRHRSVWHRQK